ncbi:hypothetical protein EJB05_08706, partial [Eragrostis curvula]
MVSLPSTTKPEQGSKRPGGGRTPGSRHSKQSANHVENERQRREKMNRRFCELRAAVPTVSRMDKTSLLADATAYINQLRARVAQLEAQQARASSSYPCNATAGAPDEEVQVSVAAGAEAVAVRLSTRRRRSWRCSGRLSSKCDTLVSVEFIVIET